MLSDNIKKVMKSKKITSKLLAQLVGVTPAHISYILNNKREPSMDLVKKIAEALEVQEKDLFDNTTLTENQEITKKHQINTVAAHLESKNITPEKLKLLNDYIDILFKDEF